MEQKNATWNDRRIEVIIGVMLMAGVIIAALVLVVGAVLYLLKYGGARPDYSIFRGEPAEFRSLAGIIDAARDLRGRAIIQLGLVLLIATPVARVAFSIVAFAMERDYLYTFITLIVFAILIFSLSGAGMALMAH
jgi:uncharacterized membrane protein